MPTPKRNVRERPATPLPRGKALERLQSLCALAKAHARARATGALATASARKPRPPKKVTMESTYRNLEARIEAMIELETRWRIGELGVPYTEEITKRFARFRFDSEHRRHLEAAQTVASR